MAYPTAGYFLGFDTQSAHEYLSLTGTAAVQTTTKKTGSAALQVNPVTTAVGYIRVQGIAATGVLGDLSLPTSYAGFWFRAGTLPSTGSEEIARIDIGGIATAKLTVRVTSTGLLEVYASNGTTLLATGAVALAVNTWYFIVIETGTGTNAPFAVTRYSEAEAILEVISGTGNLATSSAGSMRLGKGTNRTGETVNFYYDSPYLLDQNIGPAYCSLMAVQPEDGAYNSWDAAGTGAPVVHPSTGANLGEIPWVDAAGDGEYNQTSTSGAAATYAAATAAAAGITGLGIAGLKVMAFVKDAGGVTALQVRLRSGTTDLDTTSSDPGNAAYVNRQLVAFTDPATLLPWVKAAIDDIEIGVEANAAAEHRITALTAMALWTTGSLSTPNSPNLVGDITNMDEYRAAQMGGLKAIGREAVPTITSAALLFPAVPKDTVMVELTVRAGTITILWGATDGLGGVTAPTSSIGNDYVTGTYRFAITQAQAKKVKAISASGTGYITYWGMNEAEARH